MRRQLATAALVAADSAVLVGMAPDVEVIRHLRAPHEWLAAVGADAAAAQVASAALWLAAVWLAVGLGALLGACLPGSVGRMADAVAHIVLPRGVYRLAAGAAGLGVLLSPALADAAAPGSSATAPAHPSTVAPTPSWPSDVPLPAPVWPASTAQPHRPPTAPQSPASTSPPDTGSARHPDHGTHGASAVVVHRGDSLWRIAANQLPGRPSQRAIATSWPRWYAANRATVGNDPDYLVPGQLLHHPIEEDRS